MSDENRTHDPESAVDDTIEGAVPIDIDPPRTMQSMLMLCRDQFKFYEAAHRTKSTPVGAMKAAVNQQFAAAIESTLAEHASVADDIIEKALTALFATNEWDDEHEALLARWRASRGEDAMSDWHWWVGEDSEDEPYSCDALSESDAVNRGYEMFRAEGAFRIVEVRTWNDCVKEEEVTFAEQRNQQSYKVPPPPRPVLPSIGTASPAIDKSGRHG